MLKHAVWAAACAAAWTAAANGQLRNGWMLEVEYMPGPGSIVGGRIEAFVVGQVGYFPFPPPSTYNPIPLLEGTWGTSDFSPRDVRVRTENTARFMVYDGTGKSVAVDPAAVGHGSVVIRVVPAPGAGGMLALLGLLASRRPGRRWTDV